MMECVMKFGRHLLLASLDYHVQSLMLKMWCSLHWDSFRVLRIFLS